MNIFEEVKEPEVTIDQDVDYLDQLVGENKKFKSVNDLAKGKAEADRYVEVLKNKLDEATKELNTRTSLDSFLDKMKNPGNVEPPVVTPPSDAKGPLDDSEIEARILKALEARESQRAQETNVEKVTRVMQEQFGDNARLVINKKSKELGISANELQAMAARSPSAFFTLVGVSETPSPGLAPVVPRNGFNGAATNAVSGVKNKAYYDKMKAADPKKYFDPKTTVEMMRDMAECRKRGYAWE